MSTLQDATLSGPALDHFLDETEHALELQTRSGLSPHLQRESLDTALRRGRCSADSMDAVLRLHRLWLRAGQPAEALQVITRDGAAVLAALPSAERPPARLHLAFWRLDVLWAHAGPDASAVADAMKDAQDRLEALGADGPEEAWEHLADRAAAAGDHERVRSCARARHAQATARRDRAAYRAWDDALLASRLASSHAAQGQAAAAELAVRQAIAALSGCAPGQEVDAEDWLRLADALVTAAPGCVAAIEAGLHACTPPQASPAGHRRIEVRLARLHAHASHRQGRLHDALAHAARGHFRLDEDDDDGFGARRLTWLAEAGRLDEAAVLAFTSIFHAQLPAAHEAARLAERELAAGAAGTTGALWALTMATAMRVDSLLHLAGDEDPEAFRERYLVLAGQLAPDLPALALIQTRRRLDEDAATDAPLVAFEDAARRCPEFSNGTIVLEIWLERMRRYGVEAALRRDFIEARSGADSYQVGVELADLRDQLPKRTPWPATAVAAMQRRYYAAGLAQFEGFFESGRGCYLDGSPHTYSMLCNNLAILLRHSGSAADVEHAMVLHRKGIAASPFSEHFDGLLYSELLRVDGNEGSAGYVAAADRLWNFAAAHGYGRHRPDYYIGNVVLHLCRLQRHVEIPIWFQRLDAWWRSLDDAQRTECHDSWLAEVARVLSMMADTQAEDAVVHLEPLLQDVRAQSDPLVRARAALVLRQAGRYAQSLQVYEEALAICPVDGDDVDRTTRAHIEAGMAQCRAALTEGTTTAQRRPWWRFWG